MLIKIKYKLIGTDEKKRFLENIVSLSILQGANYILPLLTLPYLVRVLGPEYFGLLAFVSATVAYFILITDYGFNLSATRQVSIYRDDINKLNEIYSSTMIIKTALMIVSFLIMILLFLVIEKINQNRNLYLITFGMVLGQIIFPVWLFQGMEKMKYITFISIGTRIFFTLCVFVFVNNQSDYLLVAALTTMGAIVSGILSLILVNKNLGIRFVWQPNNILKLHLIEGWHMFFSSMAISLYTISTTFILGLFGNSASVGYYSAADKIVQAVKGLYSPVAQSMYPLISKKMNEDKLAGIAFAMKATWVVGFIMLFVSILLFIFARPIINILLGDQYQQSVSLLEIMAFLPLIIALSNIFGIQIMLNLGYKKEFSFIVGVAAITGVILTLILTQIYDAIGTSIAMLLVEIFITIALGLFVKLKVKSRLKNS